MAFSVPSCPKSGPKTLEDLAEERRLEAIRKNIPESACRIMHRLVDESTLTELGGYNNLFNGKSIRIEYVEGVGLKIEYKGKLVFHYDSKESGPIDSYVKKYLPGEWEDELPKLKELGERLKVRTEEEEKIKYEKEREDELKENFGL